MSLFEQLKTDGYLPYLVGGGAAAALTIGYFTLRKSCKENHLVVAPKDVVVVRQIPRGPYAPSLSPYPIKLETYLRMAKIPYKNVFGMKMSPRTQKTPWAQLNGEILTDSQFIIEHVNKHFKVDTMSHLTPSDRAVARSFMKMLEDATIMPLARWRWQLDPNNFAAKTLNLSAFTIWIMKRQITKILYGHGIGRITVEEMLHLFRCDLEALSTYLGKKKFLMGDQPCEVDCTVFGQLVQYKWHSPDSPILTIMDEFPNLHAYSDRMKDTFWPDWNECITHGGTREATK